MTLNFVIRYNHLRYLLCIMYSAVKCILIESLLHWTREVAHGFILINLFFLLYSNGNDKC